MNIIIDKEIHDYLQTIIIDTIEFGSAMKGKKTPTSDSDFLHIVKPHKCFAVSPIYVNHLLQYKDEENNADHIYCTSVQFVENLFNAESMINHEILRAGALQNTSMEWLNSFKEAFDNFKTYRGYLGFCRRDLKDCSRLFKDKRKSYKKLMFVDEALSYLGQCGFIVCYVDPDIVYLPYNEFIVELEEYIKAVDSLRHYIGVAYERKEISYSVLVHDFNEISKFLSSIEFLPNNIFSDKIMACYYKAMVLNEFK